MPTLRSLLCFAIFNSYYFFSTYSLSSCLDVIILSANSSIPAKVPSFLHDIPCHYICKGTLLSIYDEYTLLFGRVLFLQTQFRAAIINLIVSPLQIVLSHVLEMILVIISTLNRTKIIQLI